MEQFLQEWNEACAYANECLPPFVYTADNDLWGFLFAVSFICFMIWLVNETKRGK